MGIHMRLAAIEKSLVELVRDQDFCDVDFSIQKVNESKMRSERLVDVDLHWDLEPEAGGSGSIRYRFHLKEKPDDGAHASSPMGYNVELLGVMVDGHAPGFKELKPIDPHRHDDDPEFLAELGKKLGHEIWNYEYCG